MLEAFHCSNKIDDKKFGTVSFYNLVKDETSFQHFIFQYTPNFIPNCQFIFCLQAVSNWHVVVILSNERNHGISCSN